MGITEGTFRMINSKNLSPFSILALDFQKRFQEVNQPLPWIEPSINMIHLDAVRAFVFGSSLASIGCAVYLLEHSLRMAIWDDQESGSRRKELSDKFFYETMKNLLSDKKYQSKVAQIIPDADDLEWWNVVTKEVRNKVNHVDFPAIFRIAKELNLQHDYAYSGLLEPTTWNPRDSHSWGMFWHRFGDKLAADFLKEVTGQVRKLINKTEWKPDEAWWISQKNEYELFFQEDWSFDNLTQSLNKIYGE